MHPGEIWNGKSPGARLARIALIPGSWLYAFGWQAYLATYKLGFKKSKEPHRPVICIGNLLAGGGGKSPLTVHLVKVLRELGKTVVVSASGYGSPRAEAATLAPEGPLDPKEWGDEPAMLRWLIPDLPLIVGRRRVLAAELCGQNFPHAVLLMDDGFQHLPLKKHVTILLDPENPQNGHCLPAGPYREPRMNRRRADLVIPGKYQIHHEPLRFVTAEGASVMPTRGSVLCALGRPEKFVQSLQDAGVNLGVQMLLPDHDGLEAGTLIEEFPESAPVIVTAKDWVKLRERKDIGNRTFLIALQSAEVSPSADFRSWLKQRLDG